MRAFVQKKLENLNSYYLFSRLQCCIYSSSLLRFLSAALWTQPCVDDTSIRGIRLIYLQTPLCGSYPKLPSCAMLSKFLSCCVHSD